MPLFIVRSSFENVFNLFLYHMSQTIMLALLQDIVLFVLIYNNKKSPLLFIFLLEYAIRKIKIIWKQVQHISY
jgi:hypothetical protein